MDRHNLPFPPTNGYLPLIEFRQALFHPSLQPIDWTLRQGEQWAIAGPTGSGKAMITNGILKKALLISGRILYYFDQPFGEKKPGSAFFKKGDILRVSTSDAGPAISIADGFYQARWHSMQEMETPLVADYLSPESFHRLSPFEVTLTPEAPRPVSLEADSLIALLDIGNLMTRRIQQLSNGELRKVLIARALINHPKLLILDDPFAGLDTISRKTFRRVLENLLASGKFQMLLVTARPEDIPEGITHILRMERGGVTALLRKEIDADVIISQPDSVPAFLPDTAPSHDDDDCPVIIDMTDICVFYNGIKILDKINLQVHGGERWAVLGPNGSGKSTLLSLILADNPQAYANDISLFGRKRGSGESIWGIKEHMGALSPELQIYYNNKYITCLEVVCSGFFDSIGLYNTCSPRQIGVATEWMARLGIPDTKNQPFNRISEGWQRIVLLARALVKSPRLLVLDEPCQGLDRETRTRIIRLIDQACCQRNISLLYVTHDIHELPGVTTHVLTLDGGKITSCGPRKRWRGPS